MTSPIIGGNAGLYVSDIGKLQAIDAVLKNTEYSQTEALILIGLIIRSDKTYGNAFPGAGTLAVYAKVNKTQTVFKALRNLEEHFQVVHRASRGSGRSNSYAVLPQKVVDAIVSEYDAKKRSASTTPTQSPERPGPLEVPPLNGPGCETQSVKRTGSEPKPTSLNGLGANPNPVPSGDRVLSTQSPERPATQSPERPAYPFHDPVPRKKEDGSGNKFLPINWASALNPSSAEDAKDVFWREDGTIEVINGFKVELEETFPSVDLASGLAIVAGEARPDETGTALKRRIRRRFGYLQNDERNRDRRAQQRTSGNSVRPSESRAARLLRHVEQAAEKGGRP